MGAFRHPDLHFEVFQTRELIAATTVCQGHLKVALVIEDVAIITDITKKKTQFEYL